MAEAASRHVVDRCPTCGLEHDVRVHECEACHTPLRYWCRRHGRETGWLDGPACARCADEAARPAAPVPAPPAEPLFPTPPVVAAGSAPAPAKVEEAKPPAKPEPAFGRVIVMLFMLGMTTGGGALLGVIPGLIVALLTVGDLGTLARNFALGGAIPGGLFGLWCCVEYSREQRGLRRAHDAAAPSTAPPGSA